MDEPGFDDDYFALDEHEDLDYYLAHTPYLQKNALEQDPQGLVLDEEKGAHRYIFQTQEEPPNSNIIDRVQRDAEVRALPPDNIQIPPLPQKDKKQLQRILVGKKRHLDEVDEEARSEPRYILLNKFSEPVNEYSSFEINDRGEAMDCENEPPPDAMPTVDVDEYDAGMVPCLIADPQAMRICSDENLYQLIPQYYPEFKKVSTSARAFNGAIIQMEANFNVREVEDALLYNKAKRISEVLSTLVYCYIDIFYARNPQHKRDREFKVQVLLAIVVKKLRKDSQGRYIDGVYDYATHYKEAMITEEGRVVKFNTPDAAFKCTYNTSIKVINQSLDSLNVPNLDSSWRYAALRGATVRLFCFKSVVQIGQGFFELPPYIANKKACINPKSDHSCFWWAVKIGMILNRKDIPLDYDEEDEEKLKKVQEKRQKLFQKLQVLSNITKGCKYLGIIHQTSPDGERLFETETKGGVRNAELLQGTLPDDMELDRKLFDKFCLQNPKLMLSVFVESGSKKMPVKMIYEGNNSPANERIKLLYLGQKDVYGHYVCIKDFNRFLTNAGTSVHHKKVWCEQCQRYRLATSDPCKHMKIRKKLGEAEQVYCCDKCMATFSCKEELDRHGHMCLIVDKNYRIVELPKERKYLEFDMKKKSCMMKKEK